MLRKDNIENTGSTASKEKPEKNPKPPRFEWKNQYQHALFFYGYLLDWSAYLQVIYEDGDDVPDHSPTIIHFFIVAVTLAGPILFLQNFVGQYNKKGCMCVGKMFALTYGFGFSMVSISLFDFTIQLYYTGILMFYFLAALSNPFPPWMFCFQGFYHHYPNCFSLKDIDMCPSHRLSKEPCYEPGTKIPAPYIFKDVIAFKKVRLSPDNEMWLYSDPSFNMAFHGFHMLLVFIFIMIGTRLTFKSFEFAWRVSVSFCTIGSFVILVLGFTQYGPFFGLVKMFKNITLTTFLSIQTWFVCFRRTVGLLHLAEGAHILFGSYIPASDKAPYRAVTLVTVYMILVLYTTIHYHVYRGLLTYKFNMSLKELELETIEDTIFILYPLVLGIQASPQIFCVTYFLIMCMISYCSLLMKLIVLESTISDHFDIYEYSFYIRFTICAVTTACTFAMAIPNAEPIMCTIKHELKAYSLVLVFIFFVIVFVYGVQRTCDDIEFYLHTRVAKFIKFSWVVSFLTCLFILVSETDDEVEHAFHELVLLIVFCSAFAPMIVYFGIQFYKYIKQRNLIGIFRPLDDYGPPDMQTKIMRILYNPRFAVKYRKQLEICNHRCLIDSKAHETAIEEEIDMLSTTIRTLELNEDNSRENEQVIKDLKRHRELVYLYCKKRKFDLSPV